MDFYRRFGRSGSDRRELRFAKRLSMLVSAWMIGGAVLIHYIPKESINDLTIVLGSLLGGGLLSIWMGMYLDWVFRSLCFYLRFRRGSWLEQSVI